MKKLIVLLLALLLASLTYTQADTTAKKTNPIQVAPSHPDGYLYQNAKLHLCKNGNVTVMNNDITLANGMIIMQSGYYMRKDGVRTALKEGDHIDYNGKLTNSNKDKINQKNEKKVIPDGYYFTKGKLMLVNKGKMTEAPLDVVLSNGTALMKNGSYMKKGGKKMKLMEGDHFDMKGKMSNHNTDKK
ncbi:MAG: DUF6799 domain-containing protein [Flavobacteriales bacterium]|jgi:hypothetical protein